jgi:hypothetical protein
MKRLNKQTNKKTKKTIIMFNTFQSQQNQIEKSRLEFKMAAITRQTLNTGLYGMFFAYTRKLIKSKQYNNSHMHREKTQFHMDVSL